MTNLKSYLSRCNLVIDQIDWNTEHPEHSGSNIRLLKESAIRFARWTLHIDQIPENMSPPFFDLAECLAPGVKPSSEVDIRSISNSIARMTLPWIQRWYWLLDTNVPFELKELDPFEPLLLCFERGGRPYYHDGFLHIAHSISLACGYGQWPNSFSEKIPTPICEIDFRKLDADFRERFS